MRSIEEKERSIPGLLKNFPGMNTYGRETWFQLVECISRISTLNVACQVNSLSAMIENLHPSTAKKIANLLDANPGVSLLFAHSVLHALNKPTNLVSTVLKVTTAPISMFRARLRGQTPDVSAVYLRVYRVNVRNNCNITDKSDAVPVRVLCSAASKTLRTMRNCVWGMSERIMVLAVTKDDFIHLPGVFKGGSSVTAAKYGNFVKELKALDKVGPLISTDSIGPLAVPETLIFLFSFDRDLHELAVSELELFFKKVDLPYSLFAGNHELFVNV